MKKLKISLLLLAMSMIFVSACKTTTPPAETPPNIVDLIKGKTYRLGNVLNGVTNENSKFTGFTIAFNAAGNSATLTCNCDATTGGTFTGTMLNASVNGNIQNPGTITFTGTPPNAWPTSFSNVSTNAQGSVLNFNATIGLTGKPQVNYTFNLVQ
jgi:hypothetical protein